MPPANRAASDVHEWPWWRVVLLGLGLIVLLLVAIAGTVAIGDHVSRVSPLPDQVNDVAGLPVVLTLYAAYARYVIRLPASFFPIGRPSSAAGFWASFGLGLPVTVLIVFAVGGFLMPTGGPAPPGTAPGLVVDTLAIGLVTGVLEEFVFRGYLYRLVEARWNAAAAILAPAAVFALLHQGHAETPAALAFISATTFLAGTLLAVVVYRTRDVWNAVLVHAGWNVVFAGRVVSIQSPGDPRPAAIIVLEHAVDDWLVPPGVPLSAGPVAIGVLLLAIGVVARVDSLPGAAHTSPVRIR